MMIVIGLAVIRVSPGVALVKREDALWATTCAFSDRKPQCREWAIGPGLLILYGAFRRGDIRRWTTDSDAYFSASEDSTTVTGDSNRLRTCHPIALPYLIGEPAATRDRSVVRQVLAPEALRQPWSRAADTQTASDTLQRLGTDASSWDWAAGTTITITKSTQRAARGLNRRVRRRSKKLP